MLLSVLLYSAISHSAQLQLNFSQPATDWESQSLPIGNGAMGANVMGGIAHDALQFAEKTLWTGGPRSQQGYDFGLPNETDYAAKLAVIQTQLQHQPQLSAEQVARVLGRKDQGYGSYQSFATVNMHFAHQPAKVQDYQRSLDLNQAVALVTYQYEGVNYRREYFASYPDKVIVVRLSADQPGKISVALSLSTAANRSAELSISEQQISLSGQLHDNKQQYATVLQVAQRQGQRRVDEKQIHISLADEVWFTVAAQTNYRLHYPDYLGEDANKQLDASIKAIAGRSYEQLLQRHLVDYQALFGRLDFGLNQAESTLTTPQLLSGYKRTNSPPEDRALEVLYYQYGRYLLISSSRAGSLPANLQGVWNQYEQAPWSGDYHVNINLQMNYWLADVTNLSETLVPLFDFVDSLAEPGTQTAQRLFNARGWTLLLNTNIWGFSGLIAWPTAFWQPEAGAWLTSHYYEHYLFSRDIQFLRQRAYPLMLAASEFWLDSLVSDNQGTLLVSPSYSPEHGAFTQGAAMSQQIVYQLLSDTADAAAILNDIDNQQKLRAALQKLEPGLRIGSWGQLQEWRADLDQPDNTHRHVSHLYALHPGKQISPQLTPQLAEAAKVSLNARGDGGTGWSKAWKINFWARLLDGERAHKLLQEQLVNSTLSNLWSNHPPFQIDGNFGATAGISELLLQSHSGQLQLLPALPVAWSEGYISGLKARGNITVDLVWQHGKLQLARLISPISQTINLNCANCDITSKITTKDGASVNFTMAQGTLQFRADSNIAYVLTTQSGAGP